MNNYIQSDCFAMGIDKTCRALKVDDCLKCNFYKTEEQLTIEQSKAKARLVKLGAVSILEKYHPKKEI